MLKNKLISIFSFYLRKFLVFFVSKDEQNFLFFEHRIQSWCPKGLMILYNGIEFYVKRFSSDEEGVCNLMSDNTDKMYVVCEYFDFDKKEFVEKIFHEDFLKNRIKVNKAIEV